MCQPSADFRVGDVHRDIYLIGACPGKAEEENGRPFIGDAGENLQIMIESLHERDPGLFPTGNRDDYTMLNAHDLPRYASRNGYDGNSEPSQVEVIAPDNQDRILAKFRQVAPSVILYLGNTAEFTHPVVQRYMPAPVVFRTGHPSKPAWNTQPGYVGLQREEKLQRWARDQFRQIE
jgi:uracil-DNA glycosylase